MQERRKLLSMLGALLFGAWAGPASAAFPQKHVTLVVGFPPGGSVDTLARILATKFGERLGQAVNVDNRVGATGTIAAASVARAPADGHTLLFAASGHTISAAMLPLKYDAVGDFEPVGMVAVVPNILVVHPSVPVQNVQELVALAKQSPGSLHFASTGNTSVNRMAAELFQVQSGVKMTHVPYKGSGQAITDLLSGRVQVAFDQASSVLQHVRAGKLRAIAATTTERISDLPDLPTLSESGLKGYLVTSWNALLAPAGTPREVIAALSREMRFVLQLPEVRSMIAKAGAEPIGGTPDELAAFLRADIAKWQGIVRSTGIKAD